MQAEFYIALVRIQPKPSGLGYLNTYRQLKSLGSCPQLRGEQSQAAVAIGTGFKSEKDSTPKSASQRVKHYKYYVENSQC